MQRKPVHVPEVGGSNVFLRSVLATFFSFLAISIPSSVLGLCIATCLTVLSLTNGIEKNSLAFP